MTERPGSNKQPRLNPVAKLVMLATFSVLVILVMNVVIMVAMLALVVAAALAFDSRSAVTKGILGFAVAIFVAQVLFNESGDTLARVVLISIHQGGVVSGILISGKFLSLIGMSWVFVATTSPSDLSNALTSIGLPYRFAFLPALSMRFVPVFRIEYGTVREAQTTRGLRLERNFRGLVRSAKYTMTPMLVSAMSKANSLAASMTGRGFGAFPNRTMLNPQKLTRLDVIAMLLGVGTAVGIFWLSISVRVPGIT